MASHMPHERFNHDNGMLDDRYHCSVSSPAIHCTNHLPQHSQVNSTMSRLDNLSKHFQLELQKGNLFHKQIKTRKEISYQPNFLKKQSYIPQRLVTESST